MKTRRRTQSDGITSRVEITYVLDTADKRTLADLTPAERRTAVAHAHSTGEAILKIVQEREEDKATPRRAFDRQIASVEEWCRHILAVARSSSRAKYGSASWYAHNLVRHIALVRQKLDDGEAGRAAAYATAIGWLAAEAAAKHQWPVVRLGLKRQRQVASWAKLGGEARRQDAHAGRRMLLRDVTEWRTRHPQHSLRTIATHLLQKYGGKRDDQSQKQAIDALAQRILRVEKTAAQ